VHESICSTKVVFPLVGSTEQINQTMKKSNFINVSSILVLTIGLSCSNQAADRDRLQTEIDRLSSRLDSCQTARQNEETAKALVADMYQGIFGDKNVDAADKYIMENYIQHNPTVADGRQALKDALSQWFKNAPREKIDIQHIGADGDFVYIRTRTQSGDKIMSVIDIFRIESGKIAEHWDVIQEVPAKAANDHPMF